LQATCCEHLTCIDLNEEEVEEKEEELNEKSTKTNALKKFSTTAKVAVFMGNLNGTLGNQDDIQSQDGNKSVNNDEMANFEPMLDQFMESVHGNYDKERFSTKAKSKARRMSKAATGTQVNCFIKHIFFF
jgi:hypothetical protein